MSTRGKCPDTGKTIYADRRDARLALNKLIDRRPGHRHERGAYNCKFCGKWHITCMGEKQRAPKPTRLEPSQRWRWSRKPEED